ncbi:hypothetical protein [Microbacterium sp. NPDC089188]|uniref:hypothetical protein n=1 Tax=Microbacterium sp. NPDC089188 TaxID=3154971 RepID=UPI003413B5F1
MVLREQLTDGFQRWLNATITAPAGAKVSLFDIDPYRSSTRSIAKALETMRHIEAGTLLTQTAKMAGQRLADTRHTRLVAGDVDQPAITPLGRSFKRTLEAHAIWELDDEDAERHELPRNIALLLRALDMNTSAYQEYLSRWRYLRTLRPAQEWFDDPDGLIMSLVFNVERVGFTPLRVMLAAGVPPWQHKAELKTWSNEMAIPDGWDESRLAVLLRDRVQAAVARIGPRRRFHQAMEAVCQRGEGVTAPALGKVIEEWAGTK